MRVLLIATVQSHIGQFHKPLMKLLKESGWEIHVAARDNLDEKNGLQLDYPDRIFNVPFQRSPLDRRNIEAYKQLKRILTEYHYDVIHCNTPVGGILGRIAANKYRKGGKTKVFYTVHGFHFYKGAPIQNWLIYYPIEKIMSRFTDKLITITKEDYKLAKRRLHCPVFHIHGVGANTTKYFPLNEETQEKQKAELGLSGCIIMIVGELLPNKNQKTAILAMKSVIEQFPDAHLLIASNGSERENLERIVRTERLGNNVQFIGYTTHLEKYLQICDLEVACSYREGLPLNIVEAMLCGKPVVASHNRGHNELVKDGINGYLVAPDDVDGFSEKICEVLERNELSESQIIKSIRLYRDVSVREELKVIYDV